MRKGGFTEEQWLLTLRVAFYLFSSSTLTHLLAVFISKVRARFTEIPWGLFAANPFLCLFFSLFISIGLRGESLAMMCGGFFASVFVLLPALANLIQSIFSGRPWVERNAKTLKRSGVILVKLCSGAFVGGILYFLFDSVLGFIVVFVFLGFPQSKSRSGSSGGSRSRSSTGQSSGSSSSSSSSGGGSSGGGGSSSSW
ncbi:MAG: hypothetical protein KGP28_05810 [Bdellovibrionales bacterium]|nr:hypothetical protein [Bdellovibrionales bacterium]